MTFAPSATLIRTTDAIATEVDGEIVLISIEDGRYYGMDAVGSEIWRRLENPKRVDALIAELQAHFDGPADAVASDTQAFLGKLAENRLVWAEA